ncbi:LuxR family transcriptional regulator [Symbioplanes lichenis]|uniref:LuxR family transcriptional regulator n=1 Tax=Symbioplanes lichenis TaxID=1629072 RepID=UPI00273896E4|nr:LuxR family transcriptional regulator [Actinoplanes lichenis]
MGTLPSGTELLVGRAAEQRRIDELTAAARAGRGGALVLRGEAGIGKTALLDQAVRTTAGLAIVRAAGSELERELPYSALHQLCVPLLGQLTGLPARHREALQVAFGLTDGTPDPLRIGLAALGLLTAAAQEQPLLGLVDDAQWLDSASAQAMLFIARRIATDPIAMIFAVRTPVIGVAEGAPGEGDRLAGGQGGHVERDDGARVRRAGHVGFDELPGLPIAGLDELPGLPVAGLDAGAAAAVLAARHPVGLDDQVRDRLVAEAQGNPLALLELPRAGGFVPPGTASVPARIEYGFRARLADLSAPARLLLTVAGADPTGDPGLLWPAARTLGLDLAAATAEVTATGLADFGSRVRFCHPLARSVAYDSAPVADRHAAHAALAAATDPVAAPDRRAWHRAQAATGPDDELADELERRASRAQARGGMAAAAAFLERSVGLTLNPARRVARTLDAAQAHLDAGTIARAADLLSTLDAAALDDRRRARLESLRGSIALTRHGDASGPRLVVRAAQRLTDLDPGRSRDTFLDALEMSLVVGRGGVIDEVLQAAAETPSPGPPDLLHALVLQATEGYAVAVPALRAALDDPSQARRPTLAAMIAIELWDLDAHTTIADRLVKAGRAAGAPLPLRVGLAQQVVDAILTGDIGRAIAATAEEAAISDAIGAAPLIYHRLHLAALRGRREEAAELTRAAVAAPGTGLVANAHLWTAMLHNGTGDYPAALTAARQALDHDDLFLTGAVLPELIEAAVRCHEPAVAARGLATLTERTAAAGTAAGLGVAAHARGLVTGDEEHFHEAVELLSAGRLTVHLGRAQLAYGEWLRRQGRRRDCRTHLGAALDLLTRAGADAFARRAADELRATGDRVGPRTEHGYEKLTMHEVAVARLAAAGATSQEVATRLFISKRTVDAHLRNIFRKLDITSRRQLKDHPHLQETP